MKAIRCEGIKKSYGTSENRIEALKGIHIEIEQEKLTLLVGPSGSGKTTLLSIISTILTPNEGKLFLLDQEITGMTSREKSEFCRKNLGLVFQSLFLIPTLTVAENVSLPLIIDGQSEELAKQKSIHMLKEMNMAERADAFPDNLSKGQQQRVAIARALINESKIIICDEPTSALDQDCGYEIMSVLKEISLHPTRTVFIVTHDPRTFSFADEIIHISDGQITHTQVNAKDGIPGAPKPR